jgi:8-oxo-dGTP pyrophosphatase MutT (NUDIX family)
MKAGFPAMKEIKDKVFAYITHRNRLLVFIHPFAPEAGLQVPAGTIKANERPEAAVLREAFEETGLPDLMIDGFLGEVERDMSDFGRDEIHHRRFYHLCCEGNPHDTWRHEERDSPDDPSVSTPETGTLRFRCAPKFCDPGTRLLLVCKVLAACLPYLQS